MTLTAPPQAPITEVAAAARKPGKRATRRTQAAATRTLISAVDLNRHRVSYVAAVTITLLLFTAAFLFPLYWMASSALKSPVEFAQSPPTLVPHSLHPDNYSTAWS